MGAKQDFILIIHNTEDFKENEKKVLKTCFQSFSIYVENIPFYHINNSTTFDKDACQVTQ